MTTNQEHWDKANTVRAKMIQARKDYEDAVKERDSLIRELATTHKVSTLARMFKMKHQNVSKLLNTGAPNIIIPNRDEIREIANTVLNYE